MPPASELIKQLQQWRRRLDPGHALDVGQEGDDRALYVDLDAFVHEGVEHR